MSAQEKIERGKVAIETLQAYKDAVNNHDTAKINELRQLFDKNTEAGKNFYKNYFAYFGYGFLQSEKDLYPWVSLVFYSFHIMVALGLYFVLFFLLMLWFVSKGKVDERKFWLRLGLWNILFAFIASQAGWIVAEVGRQPWIIQDLMPTVAAVTRIEASNVMTTFILFAIIFTTLLIAEISIMLHAIKQGPKN